MKLHVISASTFALICLLFLLPFVSIECGSQKIATFTGVELAIGKSVDLPSFDRTKSQEKTKPNGFAIISLAATIIGLITSLALNKKAGLKITAIIFSCVISISLVLMQIDMGSKLSQKSDKFAIITANYEIGYWLSLIAPIVLIILSFVIKNAKAEVEIIP